MTNIKFLREQYPHIIKTRGYENWYNDPWRENTLIVHQILPTNLLRKCWGSVWRIWTWILGSRKVPATEAGRLRGCPLRKRRCILHCAGLGAECVTNFRPVSWAATSPQPPEYIVKSPLQILERANSGHAPQKKTVKGAENVIWPARWHWSVTRDFETSRLRFPSFPYLCWFGRRLCPSKHMKPGSRKEAIRVFIKRLSLCCVFRKCFNKLWPRL